MSELWVSDGVAQTDACSNACMDAVCGDSFVQEGVETCDDGATVSGDGCSSLCQVEVTPDAGVRDAGNRDAGSGDAGVADGGAIGADAGGGISGGSCGCRAGSSSGTSAAWLSALFGLALVTRRRRR